MDAWTAHPARLSPTHACEAVWGPMARQCANTQAVTACLSRRSHLVPVPSAAAAAAAAAAAHSRKDMEDAISSKNKTSIKDREVRTSLCLIHVQSCKQDNGSTKAKRQWHPDCAQYVYVCVLLRACRSVSRRPSLRARSHQVGDPQAACTTHSMAMCLSVTGMQVRMHVPMQAQRDGVLTGCFLCCFSACRWPPEGPLQGRRRPGWRPVWWRLR
jgi:hypothetical protein